MKVKKILVIDRKIDYHLMLKIIGPNQGIQYLGFKDSYDDKTICDYGTYFLDFAKNDYQKITKHERIIFREKNYIFFIRESCQENKYQLGRFNIENKEIIYSEDINSYVSLDFIAENGIQSYKNIILCKSMLENGKTYCYHIFNEDLKKYTHSLLDNRTSFVLKLTETNLFIQEMIKESIYIVSIDFEHGQVIRKPKTEFFENGCDIIGIQGRLLLSFADYVNLAEHETIKIVNNNLEIQQAYTYIEPRSFYIMATADDQPQMFVCEKEYLECSFRDYYSLVNWYTGEFLWRIELSTKGYLLPVTVEPIFWKDKILLSSFKGRGKGILVLDRNTGEILFYKGLKGYIQKIIPWEDNVYIYCIDGISAGCNMTHHYYKLSE